MPTLLRTFLWACMALCVFPALSASAGGGHWGGDNPGVVAPASLNASLRRHVRALSLATADGGSNLLVKPSRVDNEIGRDLKKLPNLYSLWQINFPDQFSVNSTPPPTVLIPSILALPSGSLGAAPDVATIDCTLGLQKGGVFKQKVFFNPRGSLNRQCAEPFRKNTYIVIPLLASESWFQDKTLVSNLAFDHCYGPASRGGLFITDANLKMTIDGQGVTGLTKYYVGPQDSQVDKFVGPKPAKQFKKDPAPFCIIDWSGTHDIRSGENSYIQAIGYFVVLEPLPVGHHVITYGVEGVFPPSGCDPIVSPASGKVTRQIAFDVK